MPTTTFLASGGGPMKITPARAQSADNYPTKPITLIVPYATGGTTDIVARVVGQELTQSLGKPVLVDNRTGGGGIVGWSAAARAAPDGYTLLAQELSYAIAVGLIPTLPFDAHKALTPVSTVATVPHVGRRARARGGGADPRLTRHVR